VEDLLRGLLALVKVRQIYPAGHRLVEASLERLAADFAAYFVSEETLSLGFLRSGLLLGEAPVKQKTPVIERLQQACYERGIAQIAFSRGIAPADLRLLIEALVLPREQIATAGGVEAWLAQNGCAHLRIAEFRYQTLLGVKEPPSELSQEEREIAIWKTLVHFSSDRLHQLEGQEHRLRKFFLSNPRLAEKLAALGRATNHPEADPKLTEALAPIETFIHHLTELPASDRDLFLDRLSHLAHEETEALPPGGTLPTAEQEITLDTFTKSHLLDLMAMVVALEGKATQRLVSTFKQLSQEEMEQKVLPELSRRMEAARQGQGAVPYPLWNAVEHLLLTRSEKEYMSETYTESLELLSGDRGALPPAQWEADRLMEYTGTIREEEIQWYRAQVLLELLAFETGTVEILQELGEFVEEFLLTGRYAEAAEVLRSLSPYRAPASEPDQSRAATAIFASIDPLQIVDQVAELLPTLTVNQQEGARQLLSLLQEEMVIPLLERLALEEKISTRRFLLELLAQCSSAVVPEILKRLPDAPWYYLRNLVMLLGDLRDEQAVPPLHHLLDHGNPKVQREVVAALGKIGSRRSVPLLRSILEKDAWIPTEQSDQIRILAAKSLQQIGGEEAGLALRKGSQSRRKIVRETCQKLVAERQV
jgi:hypothetical protein